MSATKIRVTDIVVAPNRVRKLRDDTVNELAELITERGLLQPIVVRPRGTSNFWLVAGRHRLEAVRKLGHDSIRAVILDGINADAARLAEIDENLVRADLSPAERALHHAERNRLYEKVHPETKHGGDRRTKNSTRQNGDLKRFTKDAASKTGRSERTVQREIERATKINNLADVIGTTLDSPDELDALAKLPEQAQRDLVARAKAGEKVQVKVAVMKARRTGRELELAAGTEAASKALGEKLYGVIYADPPWRYDSPAMGDVARLNEQHYPSMPLEEIKALPVPAAADAVLFLWATMPRLPFAIEVMAAWGFGYRSAIVWIKDKAGTGYWSRGQCELLMIGRRGDIPAPSPGEQLPPFIEAPRRRHSEKPDIFAEHIERLFPNVPKLEMFARAARPGWSVWGNEVSSNKEILRSAES